MRLFVDDGNGRTPLSPKVLLALLVLPLVVFAAGCGKGKVDYEGLVLGRWEELELASQELVGVARELHSERDLEHLRDLLRDARSEADTFWSELRKISVDKNHKKTNEMLVQFLLAYSSYLLSLERGLNVVLDGSEEELLDTEELASHSRELLEDYQYAQEYNSAWLERDVWELPQLLGEAVRLVYGGERNFPIRPGEEGAEEAEGALPEEVVASWFGSFNEGNAYAMYNLLSPYSWMLEEMGYEGLAKRVSAFWGAGLRVEYQLSGVERYQENEMEKATVTLLASYSAYTDPDSGEKHPAATEEVAVELDYVDGSWMVNRIDSSSGIW
jgi:hypothetical protein